MYPWKGNLSAWADRTKLHIDALGLVTLLGADEINVSVGRLIQSRYVDFLPLLGAFVIASNRFTQKTPGFNLYNISSGFQTTELAGWLSRWLKSQEFHQVHSKVSWKVEKRPTRKAGFWVGFVLIGFPLNGMLIALTVLSGDWWGFANASAMSLSVLVRYVLVSQNRAGIDKAIEEANKTAEEAFKNDEDEYKRRLDEYNEATDRFNAARSQGEPDQEVQTVNSTKPVAPEPPKSRKRMAKMIVVMDDSKVITMRAPENLIASIFAGNPKPPNPLYYTIFRWIGWAAFAVHIVSIGMAALLTQICTVVLLAVSTILIVAKFGCEDSTLGQDFISWCKLRMNSIGRKSKGSRDQIPEPDPDEGITCWIGSTLKASCSEYPVRYEDWKSTPTNYQSAAEDDWVPDEDEVGEAEEMQALNRRSDNQGEWKGFWPSVFTRPSTIRAHHNGQVQPPTMAHLRTEGRADRQEEPPEKRTERRQDLYVWLNLKKPEMESMKMWNLFPHETPANRRWWDEYNKKRKVHTQRLRDERERSEDLARAAAAPHDV